MIAWLVAALAADQPSRDDEPRQEGTKRRLPRLPNAAGAKVDKYFGTKLPPVCERLGCYFSDDGQRFYCINPGCQKHRKRKTKHTKVRGPKPRFAYFRCPKCHGRNVDVRADSDEYQCRACNHQWNRGANGQAD